MAKSTLRALGCAVGLVTAATVAAGVLAACDSAPGRLPITANPSTSASTTVDTRTGSDLLIGAINAMKAATSFHLVATTKSKDLSLAVNMRYTSGGASGTLTLNKSVLQIISVNEHTYVKAPDNFWLSVLSADTVKQDGLKIHNHWVDVQVSGTTFSQIEAFANKSAVVNNLAGAKKPDTYVRGVKKKIGGVTTITLSDHNDGSTIYVTASGTPYPVEAVGTKRVTAVAKFSDWSKPVTVTKPPAAQIYVLSSN